MAFVLVFCVPCALMSIFLTPPILLPDYWLICPTCVLLICSLFYLLVFAVLCQFVIDVTLVVPCPALPCPALPYPVLSCPALQSLVASCTVFPLQDIFSLFCFISLLMKSPSSCTTESSPHPTTQTLTRTGYNLYCSYGRLVFLVCLIHLAKIS